jgi:hypothetical protein
MATPYCKKEKDQQTELFPTFDGILTLPHP